MRTNASCPTRSAVLLLTGLAYIQKDKGLFGLPTVAKFLNADFVLGHASTLARSGVFSRTG